MFRAAASLLALWLAACAAGAPKTVEPPPTAPPAQDALEPPYTFALYGDCRGGHNVHRLIIEQLAKADIRYIVQTGDLVKDGTEADQWTTFHEITTALREKVPYHPAKGNHDLGKEKYFEKEFGLERSYYSLSKGPVDLFFIDSNWKLDEQLEWLAKAVAESKATHKVALFHHPCFTLVRKRVEPAAVFRDKLHARLVELGFCAVFNGHDHNFYTTERDGLRYVTTGGAGAPLYEQDPELAQEGDLFDRIYHYVLVDVEAKSMRAQVYSIEGHKMPNLVFDLCKH